MRVPSSHWAGRLALARHGCCVDGACSGWGKRLTAIEYFVCLVDGLPSTEDDGYFIPVVVWDYERDWSIWYSDDEEDPFCPYRTLRDYIWHYGRRCVPRSVAFSVPDAFPWEIAEWRKERRKDRRCTDWVMTDDIPF